MALELIYIPEEEHTKQLSVDGGMVQTIGSIQVAAYSVLPDNEFDATFEIVSDSYESLGLQMILQPVTLDMLDMVQEFKDARNNMRDSSNRIYEGLDAAMAAFVGMDDGLAELQTAMSKYGSAQDSVSVHSDDLDNAMDLTREQLKQLAVATEAIRPHISNAKITVSDISEELNQLNGTLGELQPEIDDLRDLLFDIDDDIKEIQDYLEDAGDNNADLKASLSSLGSNLNVLRKTTAAMSLSPLKTDTGRLTDDLEELEVSLGQMASSQGITVESAMLIQALAPSLGSTIDLIDDSTDLVGGAEVLIEASNELNASLGDLARDLGHTVDVLDDGMELASDNLNAFHDMSDQVLDILDTSSTMLDDIDSLLTFIIEQERQVQPALDDMDNLIGASTELLDSFSGNLEILDQISDGSRDNLEQGTDHLIAGSQNVLVNARDMTDSAAIIRSASADFKAELDKEEEVLDEDLAFLYNMDPDALKVSFTAERNSEPNTLQVMMRTEEITIDEDEEEVQRLDLEQVEQSSLWDRISKLFASLVLSVKNVIQCIKG
jgi:putative membrane protein